MKSKTLTRIICAVLALVMIFSLAGCGNPQDSGPIVVEPNYSSGDRVYVELKCHNITDLSKYIFPENMTVLGLPFNQISDLTPLAGLTNLRELDLHENQVSDLTPLADLINLTHLGLGNNQISNLTPLFGMNNLTKLYLSGNEELTQNQIDELQEKLPECRIEFIN